MSRSRCDDRLRALLPSDPRKGPTLRRLVLHRGEHDRHLLPAELPRDDAEAGERPLLRLLRRLPAERVPRLQALPAGRFSRVPGVERAWRCDGSRDEADRRRRRGPRGSAGSCVAPRLQPAAAAEDPESRAGRRSAGPRPRAAGADGTHADRSELADDGRDRTCGRLLEHPAVQRHGPVRVRAVAHRAPAPSGWRAPGGDTRPTARVSRSPESGEPVRSSRRHRRARRGGGPRRSLPPHATASARNGDSRAHARGHAHLLPSDARGSA